MRAKQLEYQLQVSLPAHLGRRRKKRGYKTHTSLGVRRSGHYLDVPHIALHTVGDVGIDAAGHALLAIGLVGNGEGDGVSRQASHIPVAVRPVIGSAVERVLSVILLSLVCRVAQLIRRLADAANIATWDGIIDGMTWVLG